MIASESAVGAAEVVHAIGDLVERLDIPWPTA
jgi:hypothetical protein